jgi:hypothetical protein
MADATGGAAGLLGVVPAGLQSLGGLAQIVFSGAKKATRNLEDLQTPTYNGSKSINDYYHEALSRYGVNPFDSAAYKQQEGQVGRNVATGINALQDRRSAIGGVSSLVGAGNDAMQNAGVVAQNERNKAFGDVANATGMKNEDDRFAYDQNTVAPFQKKLQLLAMKAAAANDMKRSGFQNMYQGLSNASAALSGGGGGASSMAGLL